MPDWFERIAKPVSAIGGLLSAIAVLVALMAVIFDWKQIYTYLNIQHVKRALYIAHCSKTYNSVPNAYPFTVFFSDSDCSPEIGRMDISTGMLSKSYICGGIDNWDIRLNPKAITFYGIKPGCGNHPSEVTVTYLGRRND